MKENKVKTIDAVVRNKICSACGACTVVCPNSCIDFVYGQRYNFPKVNSDKCSGCGKCLKVCPSSFLLNGINPGFIDEPAKEPYDCFQIHTKDNQLRTDAASGGFITGMIVHMMEKGFADGGIVARCEGENPLVAESFIALDRASVLGARGSKYAPVSSCTVLRKVIETPGQYVFVGTPCMVEGLTRIQKFLPVIKQRIVLTISFVCAGMASRLATRRYIEKSGGVNIKDVYRICYRGSGWPGRFKVFAKDNTILMDRPLIGGSLSHLVGQDHYLRCHNCLDHFARFADIVVSDPWTKEMIKNETKGRSAIMIRTERGQKAVSSAITSGDFIAGRISVQEMIAYNKHLVINPNHPRHSWLRVYQLVFFRRVKYLLPLLRYLLKNKVTGLRTTIRTRLDNKYYY
jgi:coenzyme F420 hydrogenase subunit beta